MSCMVWSPDNRHHLQPTGSRWGSDIIHSYAAGCAHGHMEPDPRSMGVHPAAQSCSEETVSGGVETLQSSLDISVPVAGQHSGELQDGGQQLSDQQTRLHLPAGTFPTRHCHPIMQLTSPDGRWETSIHRYLIMTVSESHAMSLIEGICIQLKIQSDVNHRVVFVSRSTMWEKNIQIVSCILNFNQPKTFVQMKSKV